MSHERFVEKLVDIFPKLKGHDFILLRANRSNDLEPLNIPPSSYNPREIDTSNLGQGRLYIRVGRLEVCPIHMWLNVHMR